MDLPGTDADNGPVPFVQLLNLEGVLTAQPLVAELKVGLVPSGEGCEAGPWNGGEGV